MRQRRERHPAQRRPDRQCQQWQLRCVRAVHDCGGFVNGINTLDFVVNNAGDGVNPTGIRIELSGSAEIEPPPGTPPSIQSDPEDITVLIGGSASFPGSDRRKPSQLPVAPQRCGPRRSGVIDI